MIEGEEAGPGFEYSARCNLVIAINIGAHGQRAAMGNAAAEKASRSSPEPTQLGDAPRNNWRVQRYTGNQP